MTIEIKAFANCDGATVVWRSDGHIAGCRGFALHRRAEGDAADTVLENRVGFQNDPNAKPGAHQSSEIWPIQRFMWSDYSAPQGKKVQYQVVPMLGAAGQLRKGTPSPWSNQVSIGTGTTPGFSAWFNRGMVSSQWVARELAATQASTAPTALLAKSIQTPGNSLRNELSGVLRAALLDLLRQSNARRETIYLALYELNDPELIDALKAFGSRCNLLLGSGAYGKTKDENAAVRAQLKASKTVDVYDRIVGNPHFAHNKFLVFCDGAGKPQRLWTGSTNWTVTGLCTQINNGILVESADLAAAYLQRWHTLKDAGNGYPPAVAQQGSTPAHVKVGGCPVTAWNVPVLKLVDLADARRLIQGARQGVLFLFFNPGPKGTLLNDILALQQDNLFVHGVVNQDPGGNKAPILTLHDRGTAIDAAPEAVLPASVANQLGGWFVDELHGSLVKIHSKVVLLDPFGPHPVLMTGSHNLGPKASGENDDNLLIVENAPGLAAEYAVHIMNAFDHYKFRFTHATPAAKGAAKPAKNIIWKGLEDGDTWQDGYYQAAKAREINFWFGQLTPAEPGVKPVSDVRKATAKKAQAKRAASKPSAKKPALKKPAGKKAPARKPGAKRAAAKKRR